MMSGKIDNERLYFAEKQKVNITGVELNGKILDIGGGGEGIIAQYKKNQVVAIDKIKRELEEAPDNGLKIVMDASDMKFLDNTFDTATCFFTMMYMPMEIRKKVLKETHRVLKKGGELVLWDMIIPQRIEEQKEKDIYVMRLEVTIGEKVVETGYGTRWNKEQDLQYFSELIKEADFEISESMKLGETYFLRAKKL